MKAGLTNNDLSFELMQNSVLSSLLKLRLNRAQFLILSFWGEVGIYGRWYRKALEGAILFLVDVLSLL